MLTAPKVYYYIELYSNGIEETYNLDNISRELFFRLWDIVKEIKPIEEGSNRRSFYFYAPKGSYQEYKELFDEKYDFELFENDEEKLKRLYENDRDEWFKLTFIYHKFEDEEEPYLGIYINDFYLLSNKVENKNEQINASEFLYELITISKGVIKELKNNTYNNKIANNLPYKMKFGKISRKDYYNIFTFERKKYRIREEDKKLLVNKPKGYKVPKTAREYYEAVKLCYDSIPLKKEKSYFEDTEEEKEYYSSITPKELYYKYADGRDDGLMHVSLDDKEEFKKWLNHEEPYTYVGGHPFEIVYSFTGDRSIHLYLINNRLILTGGEYPSNIQALKMYINLIKNGYDVEFTNLKQLIDIIEENDFIGILPAYVYSNPNKENGIYEYIQLDKDEYNKLKKYIIWDKINEVKLL